jgi:hypothetical protein
MTEPDRQPLTRAQLEQHLIEQLQFLESSAEAVDNGVDAEAKRLAGALHTLLYDSSTSHSVLGQLGRKDEEFWDTALPPEPGNLVAHSGLVMIASGGPEVRYVAMLDDAPVMRRVPFSTWWNAAVFIEGQTRLSRARLIQVARDQDGGGGHVAPALDRTYASLAAGDLLGWMRSDVREVTPMRGAERMALRQIAHEVLKTLKPGYNKKPNHQAAVISGGVVVTTRRPTSPAVAVLTAGRNDPCPCGSGTKYKKCHGLAA